MLVSFLAKALALAFLFGLLSQYYMWYNDTTIYESLTIQINFFS